MAGADAPDDDRSLQRRPKSIFRDIAPFVAPWEAKSSATTGDQTMDINWQGRQIAGTGGHARPARMAAENAPLAAPIDTDQTDLDFAVYISTKPVGAERLHKLLEPRARIRASCSGRPPN